MKLRGSVLAGVLMLSMTVGTLVTPALKVLGPFITDEFELSRTAFGWIITSIAGVTAATAPIAGRWADQVPGRRLILAIAATVAVLAFGMAWAPSVGVIVVLAMCSGVPNAASNPATNKVIVDRLPTGQRGLTLGVKQSGVQFGYLLAGAALPTLAVLVGWRGSFVAVGAFAAGFLLLTGALLPAGDERPRPSTDERRRPLPTDVRWLVGYATLMGSASAAFTTFLPLYSHEVLTMSPALAGFTVSLVGLLGIAARIALARAVERSNRFSGPLAALGWGAAVAVAVTMLAAVVAPGLVWVGAALAGATAVSWNAVVNFAAIARADALLAGRASGMVHMGFMLGFTVGPVAFGALADLRGAYDLAWAVVMVAFVAAALLMHLWARLVPETPSPGGYR